MATELPKAVKEGLARLHEFWESRSAQGSVQISEAPKPESKEGKARKVRNTASFFPIARLFKK
jgi:hypothetical protein